MGDGEKASLRLQFSAWHFTVPPSPPDVAGACLLFGSGFDDALGLTELADYLQESRTAQYSPPDSWFRC